MQCLIRAVKAKKVPGGWVHPANGDRLAGETEQDIFCLIAEDAATDNQIVCFAVDRTTLEQLEHNIHLALTVPPVKVRKVA